MLAVWERGGWSTPGGAVNQGEMEIDALHREIREEVGVKLNAAVPPIYLGGYQVAKARDDRVNDNFSAFAVRAYSEYFDVDHKEIEKAMWLPWEPLLSEWLAAGRPITDWNVALKSSVLPEEKRLVSRNLLCWLETYKAGRGMPCKVAPGEMCKIGFLEEIPIAATDRTEQEASTLDIASLGLISDPSVATALQARLKDSRESAEVGAAVATAKLLAQHEELTKLRANLDATDQERALHTKQIEDLQAQVTSSS